MSGAIEQLRRALDAVAAMAPEELADSDTIVELQRAQERLDAVNTRASAAFESSGTWAVDGATSAAAWVAATCHVPKALVQRRVHLGRCLRAMPATERSWLASDVSAEHVRMLAKVKDVDGFAEDEAELVELASGSRWRRFCQELAYWRQLHDANGDDADAVKQRDERRLHLSQSFQGQWFLDGVGDPIGGSIVSETLRVIEHELFEADWRAARERLGRDPVAAELERSAAQRRWDALVEMATRARTGPRGGRRPEPLFTVVVDFETFSGRVCQLANGTVVSPGSLVPWLDRAWAERVVFGPASRVIDVGVTTRLFTGADRRAVQVRDLGECFHDLCDDQGDHLQVDHIQPYGAGGATIQDNGRVACGTHNRQRNQQRRGGRPPRGP